MNFAPESRLDYRLDQGPGCPSSLLCRVGFDPIEERREPLWRGSDEPNPPSGCRTPFDAPFHDAANRKLYLTTIVKPTETLEGSDLNARRAGFYIVSFALEHPERPPRFD